MWWAQLLNNVVALLGTGVAASTNSFESIATATPSGGSTTVTFSSIPSTYKHLQIRYSYLGTTGSGAFLIVNFNSDTATNYSRHRLYGDGTTAAASGNANNGSPWASDVLYGAGTTQPCVGIMDILDYGSTTNYKTWKVLSGADLNGTGSIHLISGNWRSTSAINRIDLTMSSDTFKTVSTVALYGIKG